MKSTVFAAALIGASVGAGLSGYEVSEHMKAAPLIIPATVPASVPFDWNTYEDIVTGKVTDTACHPHDFKSLMLPCDEGGK